MSSKMYIAKEQMKMLETLCNAVGVSGDEGEVRQLVTRVVKPYADDVMEDALGNVLVTRHAKSKNSLKVMLAAHMDEVGFMIVADGEDGFYKFEIVGGIDIRQLPGKPVQVGRDHLPGVIGAKPVHLLADESEMDSKIPLDSLRIDLGPDVGKKVKPGNWATFASTFQQSAQSILAKAIDDRMGVATLIELLKHAPSDIELQLAFTVQEEVGARGAKVAAYHFDPDLAIVVDCTPAFDLPRWDGEENTLYNTRLGAGPAIYMADASTLSDPRLVRFLLQVAEKQSIPCQLRQPGAGGTDAGAIHRSRKGIPSVSISIPHRYPHSAVSVSRIADWEFTIQLLLSALCAITPELLKAER
jgi:putative aminopeptidase FrvX